MMGLRQRQGWRGKRGGRIGSLGPILALLALLSQSLVLLLPVPAMAMPATTSAPLAGLPADAALFEGGYILCQDDDGTPPSDHDKAPCQHCVDCPLCQVLHAAGSGLVPPSVPALPAPRLHAVVFTAAAIAAPSQRPASRSHQPRAPPSIARF